MTDIVQAIIHALKSDDTIATVVDDRVYRKEAPRGAVFPHLVVQKIDDLRINNTATGRYSMSRIQVTSRARAGPGENADEDADTLSEQVADALNRRVNTVIGQVSMIGIDDAGTVPDVLPDAGIYLYHRDFTIEYWY